MKKGMKENQLFPSVAYGVLAAILTYPVFAALLSPIAYMLRLQERQLWIFSMLALVASGAICGLTAGRRMPKMRTACALLASLAVSVIILALCLLVKGRIGGSAAFTSIIFTLSAVTFAYLCRNRGKRRRGRTARGLRTRPITR